MHVALIILVFRFIIPFFKRWIRGPVSNFLNQGVDQQVIGYDWLLKANGKG